MRRAVGFVVLAAAFLRVTPASAGETAPRYALSLVRGAGAETCPDARALSREVERRLQRPAFDGASSTSLEVQVTREASGYRGQVFLRDGRGALVGERTLFGEGGECESLFAATALAIALIIDPEASLDEQEGAPSAASPPASAPEAAASVPEAAASVPEAAASVPEAAASLALPSPRAGFDRSRLAGDHGRAGASVSVSGEGALALGVVPGPSMGGVLTATLRARAWGAVIRGLYLSPQSVRGESGADLRVGLTALGAGASWGVSLGERVRWTCDAGPWLGALHVAVLNPVPVSPAERVFLAVSAGTRLEARLGWRISGVAGAGLFVPLLRRGLFVEGEPEPVWRQPPVSALLAMGLGMSLP